MSNSLVSDESFKAVLQTCYKISFDSCGLLMFYKEFIYIKINNESFHYKFNCKKFNIILKNNFIHIEEKEEKVINFDNFSFVNNKPLANYIIDKKSIKNWNDYTNIQSFNNLILDKDNKIIVKDDHFIFHINDDKYIVEFIDFIGFHFMKDSMKNKIRIEYRIKEQNNNNLITAPNTTSSTAFINNCIMMVFYKISYAICEYLYFNKQYLYIVTVNKKIYKLDLDKFYVVLKKNYIWINLKRMQRMQVINSSENKSLSNYLINFKELPNKFEDNSVSSYIALQLSEDNDIDILNNNIIIRNNNKYIFINSIDYINITFKLNNNKSIINIEYSINESNNNLVPMLNPKPVINSEPVLNPKHVINSEPVLNPKPIINSEPVLNPKHVPVLNPNSNVSIATDNNIANVLLQLKNSEEENESDKRKSSNSASNNKPNKKRKLNKDPN
jgi:hypothetical protein